MTETFIEPTCGAVTREGWQCGKPAVRAQGGRWRCRRHSSPSAPDITPAQRIRFDAAARLREAKAGVRTYEERIKRLNFLKNADRATLLEVWLEETSDAISRSAVVTYTDAQWAARTIRAKVYIGAGLSQPRIDRSPVLSSDDSGGYAKAQAALWAWVAEVLCKATSEHLSTVEEAIESELINLGNAEAKVGPAEARVEAVKDV